MNDAIVANTPRLLRPDEVAAMLNSTDRFVQRLVDRGDLPAIRYGTRFLRINESDVLAFIAKHTQAPGSSQPEHLA